MIIVGKWALPSCSSPNVGESEALRGQGRPDRGRGASVDEVHECDGLGVAYAQIVKYQKGSKNIYNELVFSRLH